MSRTLQFTVSDEIGAEIEQYIYAKYGVIPSKALPGMVLSVMSKNPLTVPQIVRIEEKYGAATIAKRDSVAVPLGLDGSRTVD